MAKRGSLKGAKSLGVKWVLKLSREERQHLADSTCDRPTLDAIIRNLKVNKGSCYYCAAIAKRLNLKWS